MGSPSRSWRIEITRSAEKQITKLSQPIQKLIVRFLRERLALAQNPRQWGKPLCGDRKSLWRYRVGDYRLICDIQDDTVVVFVFEIGPQKDVHR